MCLIMLSLPYCNTCFSCLLFAPIKLYLHSFLLATLTNSYLVLNNLIKSNYTNYKFHLKNKKKTTPKHIILVIQVTTKHKYYTYFFHIHTNLLTRTRNSKPKSSICKSLWAQIVFIKNYKELERWQCSIPTIWFSQFIILFLSPNLD